mmetsp:Transcript_15377/g.33575  ORF Transcript_15377/g.33575 Transcript_15377/m.33575 type:complete len:212 (+) Transcript_15377:774-1409(+)
MTFFSEPTTASTMGLSPAPCVTLKGSSLASFCTEGSENFRPMKRFTSNMVFSGLDAAWFLAASPTRRWPSPEFQATYEGVMRLPCSLGQISTRPFFHTATQLYVVPRSMPMQVPLILPSLSAPSVGSSPPRNCRHCERAEDSFSEFVRVWNQVGEWNHLPLATCATASRTTNATIIAPQSIGVSGRAGALSCCGQPSKFGCGCETRLNAVQ